MYGCLTFNFFACTKMSARLRPSGAWSLLLIVAVSIAPSSLDSDGGRLRAHKFFPYKVDDDHNKFPTLSRLLTTGKIDKPLAGWDVLTTSKPISLAVTDSSSAIPLGVEETSKVPIVAKRGHRRTVFASRATDSDDGNSHECSVPYRFGPSCEGICHCSTVGACDRDTGSCKTGICAHGYMDPPLCQRPCPTGQFGFRCGFYCHCWKGATCDSVNGFCAPEGKCAEEWFGPSCQIRKLELSDAPVVLINRCDNITVSWRQWSSELDFGNPEIVVKNYELEERTPSRPQWWTVYRILSDDETIGGNIKKEPIIFNYTPAPDTRFYQFRVVVNGVDTNGKYVTGVPGIPTEVFQRHCPTENGGGPFVSSTGTTRKGPTLPTAVTPYITYPPHSIKTIPESTSTASTTTTTTTTTPVSAHLAQFSVTNDPNQPGDVLVSWQIGPSSPVLAQDAGLLVEMVGIGDCDPFQNSASGPQIFKLHSSSSQRLQLDRWRHYNITMLRSIAATDLEAAKLAQEHIVTSGNVPSAAVGNIQLEDVASRMARLSWAPLDCQDRGAENVTYEIRLHRTSRGSSEQTAGDANPPGTAEPDAAFFNTTTNKTWHTFMRLSSSYEYLVEIRASNKFGAGPPGHFQFTTPSEEHPRPAPEFLPPTGLTPTSVTINWSVPPAVPGLVYPALHYCELKVTSADSGVSVLLERYNNCTEKNRTIDNLQPFTRYLVELTQMTVQGQTSRQTTVVATPEAMPGPPMNIEHRPFNNSCVMVDWDPPDPPNGVIRNYSIFLSVLDSYMRLRRQSVDRYHQKEPGRLICGLMLSTQYRFSVVATSDAGQGPLAETTFWTPLAEPDPPPVPFARLAEEDDKPDDDAAPMVVLAQPVRSSTGEVTEYFLKVATEQQVQDYRNIYGSNGSLLHISPNTQADAALAALPGRLVHRVAPDRFEQQRTGPLLYQAILDVPLGQWYRVVWAYGVRLERDTRLAASVSEVVRVAGVTKYPITINYPTTTVPSTSLDPSSSPGSDVERYIYNNTIYENKDDEKINWVFGLVIALIILLVIIAIVVILLCCCWKRFDVPQEPKTIVKWNSAEQTEEPPLQLEDWFNPTTQIDDSRYVVRGQRVLTPTRYTTTINTPR